MESTSLMGKWRLVWIDGRQLVLRFKKKKKIVEIINGHPMIA